MTGHDQDAPPPLPDPAHAARIHGTPPLLGATRSLGKVTNLKRVLLPTDSVALPSIADDPLVASPASVTQARTVDFPWSVASPISPPSDLSPGWQPSTVGVAPLDMSALPERAEQIPWPSEAEMQAAWARPHDEPEQSTLTGARSWLAVPFSPVLPPREGLRSADPFDADARPSASDAAPAADPGIGSDLLEIGAADRRLDEGLEQLNAATLPPSLAAALEEPAEYFPIALEGDTTLRLAAEPAWAAGDDADTVRLDVSTARPADQTARLPPLAVPPLGSTRAPAVDPVFALDSLLGTQSAPFRAMAGIPSHPPSHAEPAIDLGSVSGLTEPTTGDLQTEASADPDAANEDRSPGSSVYGGLAEQLLEVFKEEAVEMLDILHSSLETLERGPSASALIEARRTVHTMKGSARMCGLPAITELAHGCEDLIGQPASGPDSLTPALVALLFEAATALRASVTRPASGPGSDQSLRALTTRLRGARLRPPPPPATPGAAPARGTE
ncbi:MAG: Hpt domain-containing protein, partial [Chloroflexota bacterium]